MPSVTLLLLVLALLACIGHVVSKDPNRLPLWVSVLLVILAALVTVLPRS
jgi:hypothetical protein